MLGKINLHEPALSATSINPFHGTVPNPWQSEYIAGAFSGRSGAAVALGIGYASLGTDAVGSIRMPASVIHHPTLDAHPELYSPDLRHHLTAGRYGIAQRLRQGASGRAGW